MSAAEVRAVVAALEHTEGATVALPATDTILEVGEDLIVEEVPDRRRLYRALTPQGFHAGTLRTAHEAARRAGFAATDDCGVVERFVPNARITVVPGSARNIKVTTPEDLVIAERLLSEG